MVCEEERERKVDSEAMGSKQQGQTEGRRGIREM